MILGALSLSARRAWIEIRVIITIITICIVALRKESVDRNMSALESYNIIVNVALRKESVDRNKKNRPSVGSSAASLSARRAWIEIDWASVITAMTSVALRKESVDRNYIIKVTANRPAAVALRKESVDRNIGPLIFNVQPRVALRKESVDRNKATTLNRYNFATSLSARRAWIEIKALQGFFYA